MLTKLIAFKEAYLKQEDGATAIEYGLIAAGVAVVIAAVIFAVGDELVTMFTTVQTDLATANTR